MPVVNLFAILATFMNGLAAAWALTDLTESPALLAALQFATSIPAVLLALVAGAVSDIVSRKSLILVGLGGSTVTAGVFAAITAAGIQSALSILALTVTLGAFTALAAPAWLAVIPGLVSRLDLPGTMALSAASLNVAMAAGPALAGLLIAAASPTAVFGLNALVFAISIVALRTWKPESRGGLPHEHLISAIRVGVQYFRFDRPLQVTIGKTVPLVLIGTAVPALLPALSRFQLGVGLAGFGLLAAAGGLGAVVGLVLLPLIGRRMGPDAIVTGAALAQAASIAGLAATEVRRARHTVDIRSRRRRANPVVPDVGHPSRPTRSLLRDNAIPREIPSGDKARWTSTSWRTSQCREESWSRSLSPPGPSTNCSRSEPLHVTNKSMTTSSN